MIIAPDVARATERVGDHLFNGSVNHHEGDETLFARMYPAVVGYDPSNPMSLFNNGRVSAHQPVAPKKAKEVLTGIYSFDHPLINMQRTFSYEVDRQIKPDLDDELYPLNGLHAPMASVRTVAGYPQTPVSALPRSNAEERKSLGLADKMTPRQRQIAEAVWDQVWGHYSPSAVKVPKMSNSGPIRNVNDAEFKLQYALALFANGSYDQLLATFMSGDAHALSRDFEAAIVMGVNCRWQVDNPGKTRTYWSLQDVQRSLSPTKRPITTTVVIDGVEYSDFAANRIRFINAGPWPINVALQIWATGFMYAMFSVFSATWHRDEETLDEQMEGLELWNGDVSSYDHSFSEEQIDLSLERGKRFVSAEIMDMASALYYSAYYTRPLEPNGRPAVIGDPRKYLEKQVIAGNRSGHAFTSLFAKVWKVIDTLCIFDKMGYDAVANVVPFLKGEMPLGVVNNGDDEQVWFKHDRDYQLFMKIRNQPQPDQMFKVEREKGNVFNGKVTMRTGVKQYKSIERITTPFQRMLVPERSIGGNFRKMWPYGILDRHNRRDSFPTLAQCWDIFDWAYRKELEPYHGSFLGIVRRACDQLPFNPSALSWKDIMVLDDSSKTYHRFADHEISTEVLESAFSRIQPQFFMHIVKTHYNGVVL